MLVLLGTWPAQAAPHPPEDAAFVAWMQELHASWLQPRDEALDRDAHVLQARLDPLCQGRMPPDPADLDASRRAWQAVTRSWRHREALQLGAPVARRTTKRIDFWPTRPRTIELAVRQTAEAPVAGPQAEEAMQRWGSAAQGLPALEWLLFATPQAPSAPVLRSPAHCRYAQRIAYLLTLESSQLRQDGQAEAARWQTAPAAEEVQRGRYMVLNLLVGSVELLRGRKLEKAVRQQALQLQAAPGGSPHPGREERLDAFDALRSRQTKTFLMAYTEALGQVLLGRTPGLPFTQAGPRQGLDDLLAASDAAGRREAQALQTGVRRVHAAMAALPEDPRAWNEARIRPVSQALQQLRGVIDGPIARRWNVSIEFTDADGD